MEQILRSYQRRLVNFSGNNRALVLRRLSAGLQLDLHAFDFINSQPAFALLREIIAGKKPVLLAPLADPRQANVALLSRKLREIYRKAAMLKEERGSEDLYVGWPFICGKLNDGTVIRCPLLFFPVSLELDARQYWVLNPVKNAAPILNQSFLLAYAHYNQIPADEDLRNSDLADLPKDALAFRTKLYGLLSNSNLQINFGQQLFEDKIIPFRSFTKPELETQFKAGELKLFSEAVLGIFPQAGSYLMADYDELLEKPELRSINEIFKTTSVSKHPAGNFEQNTFAPFDLDASQEMVLQEVKRGKSVVVQGPPGTGKSQLICNLVADFLARGKTVWVVCQKRAALDVVYNRLAAKGFGNFAALVHDFEADRRAVFARLKRQIEEVETYKKQNNQLSVVFAERQFLEISRRINQILQTFTDFKSALFDVSDCGWPAKELYLRSSLNKAVHDLPDLGVFTAENLPFFLPELTRFLTGSAKFDAPDYILKERKSFANYNWPERKKLEHFAEDIQVKFASFFEKLPAAIQQKNTLWQAWQLLRTESHNLAELAGLLKQESLVFSWFQVLFSSSAATLKLVSGLGKQLEGFYREEDVFFTAEEVKSAFLAVKAFRKSDAGLWQKVKWQLNYPAKNALHNLLKIFQLPFSESGITSLSIRLKKQQEAHEKFSELKLHLNDPYFHFSEKPEARNLQFSQLQHTIAAAQLAHKLVRKKWLKTEAETVLLQVEKLLGLHAQSESTAKQWEQFLTPGQIEKLAGQENYPQEFLQTIADDFEAIVAHDSQFSNFSEAEKSVAFELKKLPGSVTEIMEVFQNSVFLHWLLVLENKYPVLKLAGEQLDKLEAELQELLLQKQQRSHEIVLTRLRDKTYGNLEKNRLGNVVSYRKLYAQVSKKRNLFSLRKLQTNFGEEIQDLVPCWLASPETISAVFPVSQTPDLVIFDEASQAFAETGLPAIYRAKQVVIAGDENQLAPTDLYRSRWQEEDPETEEMFVESLLQLGSLHLPQFWLTQHYRSRFPELIYFPNQYFYHQKLQLIPEKNDLENAAPAIEFLKVNGLWEDQQNRPEAAEVVGLLFRLLAAGHSDVGIITFNFAQQTLVQDLVEAEAANRQILLPHTVLIKNIENMQGDEKQIIILSVGYAPDAKGKVVSQFGSLSQAKGENRLNVAITRAISKIYVVSSVFAEDLNVENARNEGPKMLRAFLQFARQVSMGNFNWQPAETEKQNAGIYLKDKLKQGTKTVGNLREKLPFADLVLCKNNYFCHLFRTDDDLYFSQISARQTHFDVPFRLQKRNWPYTSFYSRQFWLDPEKLVRKIQKTEC